MSLLINGPEVQLPVDEHTRPQGRMSSNLVNARQKIGRTSHNVSMSPLHTINDAVRNSADSDSLCSSWCGIDLMFPG